MKRIAAILGTATLGAVYACLPADDRPIPGEYLVTVSPSPATVQGFTTGDGWNITFDRVLVGLGGTSLTSPCAEYSEANYNRIVDLRSASPQKVSQLFGIGTCDFRFRVVSPGLDAVLGERVSEADKVRMRTPGEDPYAPLSGVSLEVSGRGTKGERTKSFQFTFRAGVRFDQCSLFAADEGSDARTADGLLREPVVQLASGERTQANIRVETENLFRSDFSGSSITQNATFAFEPFAAADQDQDGVLTLSELRAMPVQTLIDAGPFETRLSVNADDAGSQRQGPKVTIATLGDYMYLILMPQLPRFRDVMRCNSNVQVPLDGGGGGRGGF